MFDDLKEKFSSLGGKISDAGKKIKRHLPFFGKSEEDKTVAEKAIPETKDYDKQQEPFDQLRKNYTDKKDHTILDLIAEKIGENKEFDADETSAIYKIIEQMREKVLAARRKLQEQAEQALGKKEFSKEENKQESEKILERSEKPMYYFVLDMFDEEIKTVDDEIEEIEDQSGSTIPEELINKYKEVAQKRKTHLVKALNRYQQLIAKEITNAKEEAKIQAQKKKEAEEAAKNNPQAARTNQQGLDSFNTTTLSVLEQKFNEESNSDKRAILDDAWWKYGYEMQSKIESAEEKATSKNAVLEELKDDLEALEEYNLSYEHSKKTVLKNAQRQAHNEGTTTQDVLEEALKNIKDPKKIEVLREVRDEYIQKRITLKEEIKKESLEETRRQYKAQKESELKEYNRSVRGKDNAKELREKKRKEIENEAAKITIPSKELVMQQYEQKIDEAYDHSDKLILEELFSEWKNTQINSKIIAIKNKAGGNADFKKLKETFEQEIKNEKDATESQLLSEAFAQWENEQQNSMINTIIEQAKEATSTEPGKISATEWLEKKLETTQDATQKQRISLSLEKHKTTIDNRIQEIQEEAQYKYGDRLSIEAATTYLFEKKINDNANKDDYVLFAAYQDYIRQLKAEKEEEDIDKSIKKIQEARKKGRVEWETRLSNTQDPDVQAAIKSQLEAYDKETQEMIKATMAEKIDAKQQRETQEKKDETTLKEIKKEEAEEENKPKTEKTPEQNKFESLFETHYDKNYSQDDKNDEDSEDDEYDEDDEDSEEKSDEKSKEETTEQKSYIFQKVKKDKEEYFDLSEKKIDDNIGEGKSDEERKEEKKKAKENMLKNGLIPFFNRFLPFDSKNGKDCIANNVKCVVRKLLEDCKENKKENKDVIKVLENLSESVIRINNSSTAETIRIFDPQKSGKYQNEPCNAYIMAMARYIDDLYGTFQSAYTRLGMIKPKTDRKGNVIQSKSEKENTMEEIQNFKDALHRDVVIKNYRNALLYTGAFKKEENRRDTNQKSSNKKMDLQTMHLVLHRTASNMFAALTLDPAKSKIAHEAYEGLKKVLDELQQNSKSDYAFIREFWDKLGDTKLDLSQQGKSSSNSDEILGRLKKLRKLMIEHYEDLNKQKDSDEIMEIAKKYNSFSNLSNLRNLLTKINQKKGYENGLTPDEAERKNTNKTGIKK